jgi:hypothetical protein
MRHFYDFKFTMTNYKIGLDHASGKHHSPRYIGDLGLYRQYTDDEIEFRKKTVLDA